MVTDATKLEDCANRIEDPVVKDLMKYCADQLKLEIISSKCGPLHFTFIFPWQSRRIPIVVERYNDRLVRQGNISTNDVNLNSPQILDFLNQAQDPSNVFLPSIIIEYKDGESKHVAIIRDDIPIDDQVPINNRTRFLKNLVILKYQLGKFPPQML